MARIIQITALTLVTACWLSSVGCSSSNDPATGAGATAGTTTTPTAGTGNTQPTGGAGGTDSSTAGSTSIAGTSSSLGGAPAGGTFMPLCSAVPVTAAGVAPTKAGACTATDTQLCYKTCGPLATGFKSETCMNGAYIEQSGCNFPPELDATCYKIPAMIDASCPTTPPQASMPCTVATCTLCNAGGSYLDSTGAPKTGYCVCPTPGTSGVSKWSCASTTAWPCPQGKGC